MNDALEKAIKDTANKAAESEDSNDALKYTQAALNAANALMALSDIK